MTWRDAFSTFEDDLRDDYLVQTVGFLLPPTDKFLRLAMELTPEEPREVTNIPHAMVVSQEVLHSQSLQVVRTETM